MAIPVITIDGPSASGKGTVAAQVARQLGWHYLDSGALYRVLALFAREQDIDWADEEAVAELGESLPVEYVADQVWLAGQNVTEAIREEVIGIGASRVAALPLVRAALLKRQRDFCLAPGLVADGRDMGSVVFPSAFLKVFLTASAEERAARRYNQLIKKGESANLSQITQDILSRDQRDASREVAPLRHEPDALLLDTTHLTIEQSINQVLAWYQDKLTSGL